MYLLYATPDGDIGEMRSLRPIDAHGQPLRDEDMIPLPGGATVAMMPGRLAVGLDRASRRATVPAHQGWAISAFLPIGYTRTHIPSYDLAPDGQIPSGAETLPFFGYTAV